MCVIVEKIFGTNIY